MSILLIDHDPATLHLLARVLNEASLGPTIEMQSAEDAFEFLEHGVDGSRAAGIDLVIIDNELPDLTGIQACAALKAHDTYTDVPVVICSTEKESSDLRMAFVAGAVDYVRKPIDQVELLARVRAALRLRHEWIRREAHEAALKEANNTIEALRDELVSSGGLCPVTGLPNERYFYVWLKRILAKHPDEACAVVLIELDAIGNFLFYYPDDHNQGILLKVASAISSTQGRIGNLLSHLGEGRFAIAMPGATLQDAAAAAEDARLRIAELMIPHGYDARSETMTASASVVASAPGSRGWSALKPPAVSALEEAMAAGGNRIVSLAVQAT